MTARIVKRTNPKSHQTNMFKFSILLLIIFSISFLLASCAAKSEAESETNASRESVPAAQLMAQAEELFRDRTDLVKLRDGIALLKRVRHNDPKNFEAVWKLSRANFALGKYTTDDKESEKAFKDGIEAGKAAVGLEKDKPDGYFWTAANLGAKAQKTSLLNAMTSVGEIRENMKKVIELDPKYQNANAYDALAQIELESRMMGGKPEKALEYLQSALKLEKNNASIYLHLAEAYLAMDNKPEAKKHIDYVLKMKPDPDYLPEYNESREKAEKLLKTKF